VKSGKREEGRGKREEGRGKRKEVKGRRNNSGTYANQSKFAPQPPILGEIEIKVPQNWGI